MKDISNLDELNRRLADGTESIAWELDAQFRQRLCELVDWKMNEIYKRRQDPEDIVQSVLKSFFVRAANGEFQFDNRDSLWNLLSRIARNKMLKNIEKNRSGKRDVTKEQRIDAAASVCQTPTEAQAHILAEALDLALNGLGSPTPEIFRLQLHGYSVAEIIEIVLRGLDPPYPQILQMRLQGLGEQEIADQLGCLRGKVRYQLKRIQHRLASLLGENEE